MPTRLNERENAVDRDLVERHLAGDDKAFAELYRRHSARLTRYVKLRIHEPHVAEDLVQDVFSRALGAVRELRDPSRFYPWLTVIARHLVVEHHRSRARICLVSDIEGEASDDAPDSRLMREADAQDVNQAMARVRPRHRDILQMREHQGLSYDDIARQLGTPATTVPPLLFRARQALRREYFALLEDDGKLLGVIPALVAAWRRLRTRAGQYAAWLPEVNALCASATCIAVGIGTLLLPSGTVELRPKDVAAAESAPAPEAAVATAPGEQGAWLLPQALREVGSAPRPTASPPASQYVPGVAEVNIVNPERTDWDRERAREMPIYHEYGPVWFSADPEQFRRDMESTLAGNPEWMEGS